MPNTTLSLQALHAASPSKWSIYNFDCDDEGLEMADAIRQGYAKAVSDGSYKDQQGTSGFCLFGHTDAISLASVNGVPGSPSVQSAYRSELAGIAGIITAVELICTKHSIMQGDIEVGLDGSKAMNQTKGDWPLQPSQADFDLLMDLRRRIAQSPIPNHLALALDKGPSGQTYAPPTS